MLEIAKSNRLAPWSGERRTCITEKFKRGFRSVPRWFDVDGGVGNGDLAFSVQSLQSGVARIVSPLCWSLSETLTGSSLRDSAKKCSRHVRLDRRAHAPGPMKVPAEAQGEN